MADKKFYGAAQEFKVTLNESLRAGREPLEIILELAKLFGEISGEDSYYQTTREQIVSIYGFALKNKFVLENELAEVKARLEKISAAYDNPDFTEEEHIRIGYALDAHKKEIERLESLRDA